NTLCLQNPATITMNIPRCQDNIPAPSTHSCNFMARSISEEFSSGDTRYRDNDDYPHTRDKGKEKEDRDEDSSPTVKEVFDLLNCSE
ncbi:hypothetical protein L9F63_028410, partial [Diploptera punctata]